MIFEYYYYFLQAVNLLRYLSIIRSSNLEVAFETRLNTQGSATEYALLNEGQ